MFYTAKIQNWKQFTTSDVVITSSLGCVLHCKDTKLKAIHNFDEIGEDVANVVFYTAKIQNWKQFTTELSTAMSSRMLCFTLQRYKIESNSQPVSQPPIAVKSCVLHCKDTKLKAIHNKIM